MQHFIYKLKYDLYVQFQWTTYFIHKNVLLIELSLSLLKKIPVKQIGLHKYAIKKEVVI